MFFLLPTPEIFALKEESAEPSGAHAPTEVQCSASVGICSFAEMHPTVASFPGRSIHSSWAGAHTEAVAGNPTAKLPSEVWDASGALLE